MAMQVLKRNRLFLAIPLLLLIMTVLIAFAFLFFRQKSTVSQSAPLSSAEGQISGAKREEQTTIDQGLNRGSAKVVRVIDGDTIEIEGGQRVRYIGIDTPETVDPRIAPQCFGSEAAAKNRELVEGKTVSLEKDVSETDKYGRLLRYVYIDDSSTVSGQVFVNDYLVRQGYAYASTYPPDVKYQDQFTQAQNEAQQSGSGLWSACLSNRGSTPNTPSSQQQQDGCLIKGNISSSGEKIYHMPGQKYYDKTVIDTSRGERWFCTEQDAVNAGWRKSKI